MRKSFKALMAGALGLCGLIASASQAAPVPWNMPSGTVGGIQYSNGVADPIFGNVQIQAVGGGIQFTFDPQGFIAKADGSTGFSQTTSGLVSVDLTFPSGQAFSGAAVSESGDYSILGNGSVLAYGTIFATNITTGTSTSGGALNTLPAFPVSGPGVGQWTGTMATPNVANLGWTRVRVKFDNILQAVAAAGGTAFIEKKTAGTRVTIFLPEPATASVIILGGAAILVRRRKSV